MSDKLSTSLKLITALIALPLFLGFGMFSKTEAQSSESTSLGVSPSVIGNKPFIPGSSYTQDFIISRANPAQSAKAHIVLDVEESMKQWFAFPNGLVIDMPSGINRVPLKIQVNVPDDTKLGNYNGYLRVNLIEENASDNVALAPSVRIDMAVTVGDEIISNLQVRTAGIDSFAQYKQLPLKMKVENNGNRSDSLQSVLLEVLDLNDNRIEVLETYAKSEVTPFAITDIEYLIDNNLAEGEYIANIKAYYSNEVIYESKLSFVVTPGELPVVIQTSQDNSMLIAVAAGVSVFVAVIIFLILTQKRRR